jgi:hypothetical protein
MLRVNEGLLDIASSPYFVLPDSSQARQDTQSFHGLLLRSATKRCFLCAVDKDMAPLAANLCRRHSQEIPQNVDKPDIQRDIT